MHNRVFLVGKVIQTLQCVCMTFLGDLAAYLSLRTTSIMMVHSHHASQQVLNQSVWITGKTKFDLSGNPYKNDVKVSGDMIGGRSYIGLCISYKNRQGWGTSITYRQKKSDTEPYLEIRIYQTGTKGQEDARHNFGLGNTFQAESDFLTCLELVDCPAS